MSDRQLSLNQQIALFPVAIPDPVLDFLEDFNYVSALQTETSRASFDPDYLKTEGDSLKQTLEAFRAEAGKILELKVDQGGRDIPGGFIIKLTCEKGVKGIGLITRLKERTILKLVVQLGEFSEEGLKALLK